MFHAYKIDFTCDSENYNSFVFLTESKLGDDVSNITMDLYLLDKTAKASVLPNAELNLDSNKIKRAMRFHELLFNGLFGKLFLGSKSSNGGNREFLLQRDIDLLWNTSYMYLILPIEFFNVDDQVTWNINWKEVDSCVSVVDFLRSSVWLSAEQSRSTYRSSSVGSSLVDGNNASYDMIHLANRSLCIENLKDLVVISIHTGRIYYVLEALENTYAETPFDGDGGPPKFQLFWNISAKSTGSCCLIRVNPYYS